MDSDYEDYLDAIIEMGNKEKMKYQWHGEPVSVRFGYVFQEENTEKPLYWYNFECCNKEDVNVNYDEDHFVARNGNHFALIPAVEVTYGNEKSFLLANHCGIAVHKLTNGGWPGYAHFSLSGKFKEDHAPYYAIKKFDLEAYETYENKRRTWQKKNYPIEFERSEQLRLSIVQPTVSPRLKIAHR